jgi:hypothetical protein
MPMGTVSNISIFVNNVKLIREQTNNKLERRITRLNDLLLINE